ncbi:MAG: class I SAM-dependent methyltransferase [Erythrobacter sp.]|jgi:SAM-dependent methyltransferase|nr:class I SAM-dependent methyltransferase [Erythrobacter sp.]
MKAIQTDWTRALGAKEEPEPGALHDHLQEVHRRDPGFTERCARRCRDDSGRTSYEWLSEVAGRTRAPRILDLACGSGFLIATCLERYPQAERIVGVDMSATELALAHKRLPEDRVELFQAQADALTMLEDASMDAVLCHWALTLMDPVEPVLAEIRRVLAPGGIFAAIVDGPATLAPGYEEIDAMIFERVGRAVPGYVDCDLGDPRVRTPAALEALCRGAFDSAQVEIQSAVFTLTGGSAQEVAREALGFYYAAYVLPADSREALVGEIARQLAQDGQAASYSLPISRVLVRT